MPSTVIVPCSLAALVFLHNATNEGRVISYHLVLLLPFIGNILQMLMQEEWHTFASWGKNYSQV